MSKENPSPGDVFMIDQSYPVLVVRTKNEVRSIFLHSNSGEPFSATYGRTVEQLKDSDSEYLFTINGYELEQMIKEKYRNGEFKTK